MHAAVRGRALVIPEEEEKESTKPPSNMPSRPPSNLNGGKAPSQLSIAKQPSIANSKSASSISSPSRASNVPRDRPNTPTPPRPHSPEALDPEEAQIVHDALMGTRTPRTSYYAASLEPEFTSHYHDPDLCALLHKEGDASLHEVVRRALRKAVRQRVKKLGMKYDTEVRSIFISPFSLLPTLPFSQSNSTRSRTTIMTLAFTIDQITQKYALLPPLCAGFS